jgi:ribonuclease III
MTKVKSAVVSRKVCAEVSQQLDLISMLNLGKGMSGRTALPGSISAAVFESVIAAIYLDGGIEPARKFILLHLTPIIDELVLSAHQHNFKSVLQQYAQKNLPTNPEYRVLDEKGPDHSKCFEVCVEIANRRFTGAWANSKKEAEQKAALTALCELRLAAVDEEGRIRLTPEFLRKPAKKHGKAAAGESGDAPAPGFPGPFIGDI